jgi:hypothetical protein
VKDGDPFKCYRREDDDRHLGNGGASPWTRTASGGPKDWPARAGRYAGALTPALRRELAESLGLPVGALDLLPLIGWCETVANWTFPEVDAAGHIVGILRRHRAGKKVRMSGSGSGLHVPAGWKDRDGPVNVPEGPTDVLALTLCGLPAIGRPSNTGGVELLAELLKDLPASRQIIIVGERDGPRPNRVRPEVTEWPGRDGAVSTARRLAAALGRPVQWALPPVGLKDAREWVKDLASGAAEAVDWAAIGRAVSTHLVATAEWVVAEACPPDGGSADPFDPGITLADLLAADLPPPRFVIDDLLPEGVSILAGRPKGGKSWLAMLVALSAARGLSALGAPVGGPRDVLHLALEDNRRRYRDRAAKMLRGLGTTAPDRLNVRTNWPRAGSGGLLRLGEWLKAHPGGLVVIDTLARFRDPPRGRGSSYDEDYRAIADLKALADEYDAAILVIHHTRKGAAEDPFDEVSGTLGINGAADSLLVLDRQRGTNVAALFVTGRDLPEQTLTLAWAADTGLWSVTSRTDGIERPEREPKAGAAQDERCARWLRGHLGMFAWPDAELVAGAKLEGFSESAVQRAKKRLRAENPPLCSRPRGVGGAWWNWIGSRDAPLADRPEAARRELLHEPEAHQTGETDETDETGT